MQVIQEITKKILKLMSIEAEVNVSGGDEGYKIGVTTREPFLNDEEEVAVMRALQHLLRIFVKKENREQENRLTLDINGYQKNKDEELIKNSLIKAERVLLTGKEEAFETLGSYERRLIHKALESMVGIKTRSLGEGQERKLWVVKE